MADEAAKTKLERLTRSLKENPYTVMQIYMQAVVEECGGNVSEASRRMNMHRKTLQRVLQQRRQVNG